MDKILLEYKDIPWPAKSWTKNHIFILSIVILSVGIYVVSSTVMIARDGVVYINISREMADDTLNAVDETVQPPGYPFLIYLMHKTMGLFYGTESLQGWIISAQTVSLVSKLVAAIMLYFIGGYFVGFQWSFYGVLILNLLPDSVSYGSDALTDWPHLMFLSASFLLLLLGVQYGKSGIFGCAGLTAGLGYLVRPECGQVVLYGTIWLLFNVIRPQSKMKRTKVAWALILLLTGFVIIAVPYMWFKGHVFPEQGIGNFQLMSNTSHGVDSMMDVNLCLAGLSVERIIGKNTLLTNICETLIYYFFPAMLLGSYCYFRRRPEKTEQLFFAAIFIIVNIAIVVWQSECRDTPRIFLSRRHTLSLVAFTVFYIPLGLYVISCWISRINNSGENVIKAKNIQRWFSILMVIGICICMAKLFKMIPLRWEKQGYQDVADWLNKNTSAADLIAVPDRRIAFYAERKGVEYREKIPKRAIYSVSIIGDGRKDIEFSRTMTEEYSTWMNHGKKRGEKLVIYKVTD